MASHPLHETNISIFDAPPNTTHMLHNTMNEEKNCVINTTYFFIQIGKFGIMESSMKNMFV